MNEILYDIMQIPKTSIYDRVVKMIKWESYKKLKFGQT